MLSEVGGGGWHPYQPCPPQQRRHLRRRYGRRLNQIGRAGGYDCRHTLNLPAANRTQDGRITRLSMVEQRVIITKDANSVNSFLLHSQPHKLLQVSTGDTNTSELLKLCRPVPAGPQPAQSHYPSRAHPALPQPLHFPNQSDRVSTQTRLARDIPVPRDGSETVRVSERVIIRG